ncbi:arsenate reductase [Breznakia sp. PF5-3]|uniref:arsenate reductase ArsC n=1 Tax=unclassified Breznakia TaxID=2623764 RepID=UPI0024068483|nr:MULTISPECIES: arsenate reductase ArsC [unclassified Breznakia]MDF9824549.1 arsenate reductase [Breznakia sp. PM6-1]MDF9835335.1 arsenate reductase [Breznakia sp. PF5-3]MDF9837071.1 arsenate reductase [Breznakia sp. PFB2-8]MDF9858996.1 arsenate reductase [Breznakia sp. PH5-24]
MDKKKKVAFVCVHNSCRSQMAEALGRHFANEVFESYSAGTKIKANINHDAIETMKKCYSIDMEEIQYPKLLSDIPPVDIVITMGCNVDCPIIDGVYYEDWGLEDPSGKSLLEFEKTAQIIEQKVKDLKSRLMD